MPGEFVKWSPPINWENGGYGVVTDYYRHISGLITREVEYRQFQGAELGTADRTTLAIRHLCASD